LERNSANRVSGPSPWRKKIPRLLILALAIALPYLLGDEYYIHIAVKIAIWCIAVLGLGILAGFTGQISMAQASFLGIGAYASSLLALKAGFPFWACLVSAGIISSLVGLLIGYPFLRLRGHYFAISTLAFCILMAHIFSNWVFLTAGPAGVTMGPGQVSGIPDASVPIPFAGPFLFDTKTSYYYLVLFCLLLAIYVMDRLLRSTAGRAFVAMREDEDLSRAVGIDPTKYKLFAFFLSSFFAGVSGSLYAHYVHFLSADSFNFLESFFILMAVIMGGKDSIPGLLLGAIFINLLPEFLSFPAAATMISALSIAILAVILVVIIIFLPGGLVDLGKLFRSRKHG
jgi:branched-chain amino acid transport system permease protein